MREAPYLAVGRLGNARVPRVLLAEDNEMNREVLTRMLRRANYEVISVPDGLQAIETARREQPDIVLMDMSLPELDGWEATRRLKSDPATRRIPVVAVTAYAMDLDRVKIIEAGCDDVETKPVDFSKLSAKMKRLLAI